MSQNHHHELSRLFNMAPAALPSVKLSEVLGIVLIVLVYKVFISCIYTLKSLDDNGWQICHRNLVTLEECNSGNPKEK